MALLDMYSFDNVGVLSAVLHTQFDDSRSVVGSGTPSTTQARTGAHSCRIAAAGGVLTTKPLGATGSTCIVGQWFFLDATAFANISATGYLMRITEEDATVHIRVGITTGGFLKIYRDTTLLATAVIGALTFNTGYYIELKTVISDTVGTYELRVDKVNVLSATGVDTRNGGTGTWNRVAFSGVANANNQYIDDVYICDGSGSINNDFLGPQQVGCSLFVSDATSPGTHADLTPSTGTDHGALVDESAPNGDTDYNFSSTVGQIDTYHIQPVSLTGTTRGVKVSLYLKKTDAGVRTTAQVVRSGGTDYVQAAQSPLTTYAYFSNVLETDPATGTFWVAGAINAVEVGPKVVT